MSLTHSPSIVTHGLVMSYDMNNGKSFVGAPITNTLDSASINGYPTYGNGWGTYNTNQYNSNTYFSIGSISSVSNNIVTTSSAHPLFSYSVVTPQTSGGGVTAGTYYTIKKLSSTTFTLHSWNSSQDGSQGYINPATGTHKVFDDFANDVRIPVSASGFPTMWWGPPHVQNSCLVKEIIPGGFTGIRGRASTDCIRLHWIQPDGVTDGMAYGPLGQVTAGQVYTVSFWTRSVTPSAVGQSLSYQIYNYGTTTPAGYYLTAPLGAVGVWTKQSMTFTPNNPYAISYFFPSTGNMKVDVANIQFETGSIANNFVAGSRSTTGVIKDMTNTTTFTASSLTYDSNSAFSFDGSYGYVQSNSNCGITGSVTLSAWIKPSRSGQTGPHSTILCTDTGYPYGVKLMNYKNYTRCVLWLGFGGTTSYEASISNDINDNTTKMLTGSWDMSTGNVKIYINGVLQSTISTGYTTPVVLNDGKITLGTDYNNIGSGTLNKYLGSIYSAQVYNRALSDAEVKQNFNALRGRYGV